MFAGLSPEVSNAAGYTIGAVFSYTANKTWTFKSTGSLKKEFPKFLASILVAYGLNLLTLVVCIRVFDFNQYLSQLVSGGIYVVSLFVFLKHFTFKQAAN
jgi:putative flippase GtrA